MVKFEQKFWETFVCIFGIKSSSLGIICVTMSKAVITDSRQDLVDLVKRKNELAVSCMSRFC